MRTTSTNFVQGFGQLEQAMLRLPKEIATKVGVTATRKGAKVMQDAARAAAPDGPTPEGQVRGTARPRPHAKIKNNLKVKKGRSKASEAVTLLVHTGDAFQAIFVERGTIHMAAKPFMQPAIENSADAALNAISTELARGLARRGITP